MWISICSKCGKFVLAPRQLTWRCRCQAALITGYIRDPPSAKSLTWFAKYREGSDMYVGCLPKEKLDELINHLRRKRRKYVTRFVDEQKLEDTGQKQALRKVVSPTIRRKAPRRITQRRVLPTVLISEKLRERSRELKKEVFRSE